MKCSIFVPSVGNWMCKLWPAEWGKAILMSDCLCHYLLRAEHISLTQFRKCMHLPKIGIIHPVSRWKPCDVGAQVSTNTGRVFRRNPHLAGFNFKVHVAMQPTSPSSSPISAQWLVTCLTQRHTNSKHFKPVWLLSSLHLFYFLACSVFCCGNGPVGPQRWGDWRSIPPSNKMTAYSSFLKLSVESTMIWHNLRILNFKTITMAERQKSHRK